MCAVAGTVTTRITQLKLKELDTQIIKLAVKRLGGGALGDVQDTGEQSFLCMSIRHPYLIMQGPCIYFESGGHAKVGCPYHAKYTVF